MARPTPQPQPHDPRRRNRMELVMPTGSHETTETRRRLRRLRRHRHPRTPKRNAVLRGGRADRRGHCLAGDRRARRPGDRFAVVGAVQRSGIVPARRCRVGAGRQCRGAVRRLRRAAGLRHLRDLRWRSNSRAAGGLAGIHRDAAEPAGRSGNAGAGRRSATTWSPARFPVSRCRSRWSRRRTARPRWCWSRCPRTR